MKDNLMQAALRFGLIVGGIQVIYTLLLYILGIDYLSNWWLGLLGILIYLITMCYSAFQLKKVAGGFIEFKPLFVKVFVVFIGANILSVFFNIVLFNIIDSDLAILMQEAQIDQIVSIMERFGSPKEDIEKAIEPLGNFADQFSTINQIVGLFWSLAWGAILSVILAAIFKKNQNPFEEVVA